jgi:hypothetical protein
VKEGRNKKKQTNNTEVGKNVGRKRKKEDKHKERKIESN